jgi:hypothetical protein
MMHPARSGFAQKARAPLSIVRHSEVLAIHPAQNAPLPPRELLCSDTSTYICHSLLS